MKYFLSNVVILIFLFVGSLNINSAIAHSGGLDSNGCHAGKKPYHCHRAKSEMNGNRLKCSLGSRSKDCKRNNDSNSVLNNSNNQFKMDCLNSGGIPMGYQCLK